MANEIPSLPGPGYPTASARAVPKAGPAAPETAAPGAAEDSPQPSQARDGRTATQAPAESLSDVDAGAWEAAGAEADSGAQLEGRLKALHAQFTQIKESQKRAGASPQALAETQTVREHIGTLADRLRSGDYDSPAGRKQLEAEIATLDSRQGAWFSEAVHGKPAPKAPAAQAPREGGMNADAEATLALHQRTSGVLEGILSGPQRGRFQSNGDPANMHRAASNAYNEMRSINEQLARTTELDASDRAALEARFDAHLQTYQTYGTRDQSAY